MDIRIPFEILKQQIPDLKYDKRGQPVKYYKIHSGLNRAQRRAMARRENKGLKMASRSELSEVYTNIGKHASR